MKLLMGFANRETLLRVVLVLLLCWIVGSGPAFAQTCAAPGSDGPVTASGTLNTYYPPSGTGTLAAGSTSISLGAYNPAGAASSIAAGDLLLVIQMQDATIDTTNTASYGTVSAGNAGRYEFVVATNAVSTAGGSVTLQTGLVNSYVSSAGATGRQTYQVIIVPQYSSMNLGAVTAAPWNGATGGVVAIDVAGTLNLNGGYINVAGMGFRGGGAVELAGIAGQANTDYRQPTPTCTDNAANGAGGSKGEGIAGTPRCLYSAATTSVIDNTNEGYLNGSFDRGAPANAGGGATDSDPPANDQNAGGGGGGNGGAGGQGGFGWSSQANSGGFGGRTFAASASRVVLGGGGGAGSTNNSVGWMSSGGAGGGIVIVRAGAISGSGAIYADGADGQTPIENGSGSGKDGGGGGGSGGSVIVTVPSGSISSGLIITANGGNGGNTWYTQACGGTNNGWCVNDHGPGGGGGGGVILQSGGAIGWALGGQGGVSTTNSDTYGAANGSNGVFSSSVVSSSLPGSPSGAQCVPAITVTKTTTTPTVTQNSTASYKIAVKNAAAVSGVAPISATAVNVSDTLPVPLTYASNVSVTLLGGATRPSTTNPVAGAAVPAWTAFTIPAGGEVDVTFTATVPSTAPIGTYQNPATATYFDPARTTPAGTRSVSYNPASSTGEDVAVTGVPDLAITKSHVGNFAPGQTGAQYTITVSNVGGVATTGTVTVVDTLPTGLTATAIAGTGWTCVLGTLTCTRSDALAAAGSYPAITLTVNVAAGVATSVTNSVTVSGGGETNLANDTATDLTLTAPPDLTITKTHLGNFQQGQTGATYSITVSNAAGTAATTSAVTVVDTLPTGLTATALSGTGWTCDLPSLTCTRSDALAGGASYPVIALTVNVATNAPASLTNSVTVSGGGEVNTANDTATNVTAVTAMPDLTVTKTHAGNFSLNQAGATYTITVTNSGNAATAGTVTVVDTLPTGLTATAIAGTGWTCTLATLTCTRATAVAVGASYPVITVTVTVSATAAASLTNSVAVSGGGEINTSNDTATDVTTILQPDLTITKTHTGNFNPGQTGATYTLTVSNVGAMASFGTVTVVDTLPTGLTATAMAGTGWTCTLGTLTCTRATALAVGASYPVITLTVSVAGTAPFSATNSVAVSGGGDQNAANNTATDYTIIVPPDLVIDKYSAGPFQQGQTGAQYALIVSNVGGASTTGTVTVTDTLPAGLTATSISGLNWNCTLATLTCTRSDQLGRQLSYPAITILVNVAANAAANVTNTATVAGGGETNTTNDSATNITAVTQLPNLTMTKTHVGNFSQGQTGATYTLTVTNSGSAATTAGQTTSVTDTLPTGLTATAMAGTGWTCTLGTLTCTRTDALANGSSYPVITLTVNVASNAPSSVTNSVTANYTGPESSTANNTATDVTTITQLPIVAITKSHVGNFSQGQTGATYTLTVTNSGSAATTAGQTTTVTDTLPTGLTATAIAGTGWTCTLGTLVCTRTDALAIGSSYPVITLTVTVAGNAPASVTNTVTVAYTGAEASTAGNTATDVTLIGAVISGTLYSDVNHNSTLDAGETWPSGAPTTYVKLFAQGGTTALSVQTVTAGTSGAYSFPGQVAGNYTVVLSTNNTVTDTTAIIPAGWIGLQNGTGQIAVTLAAASVPNQNFGLYNGSRVTGTVFQDTGTGGGTANNGAKDGTEAGLTGVVVTASSSSTVYDTATTPAGGAFTVYIPASATSVTVTRTATAGYLATGGNVGTTGGTYSRTAETVVLTAVAGTSYTGVLFGDVPINTLSLDNTSFVQSGTSTYYPHTMVAGSAGTVTFTTSALAAPPIAGWVEAIYYDTTNPGTCSTTYSANYALVTANMAMTPGQQLCLLVKETAPVTGTGQNTVTLSATFTYTNAAPALTSVVNRTDTSSSGNGPIVRVQKTVDKTQAFPNDTLTYTITYTNIGGFPARNMTVNDSVPNSTTYLAASCGAPLPASFTACAVTTAPAVGGTGTVTWTFTGVLSVGGSGTVTLQVKVR